MMNADPRWSFLAAPLLAALGCSDPVPPPAQGAVSLEIGQPLAPVNGKNCPVVKTYLVGAVDSTTKKVSAPTATSPGLSLISGQNGSKISCSITGGNGNFKFSGSIYATSDDGNSISLSFSNGVVGPDFTGTADVGVYTPQLSANYSSPADMPCTVQILKGALDAYQIKPGSMWATFACPQVATPPSGLCGILQAQSDFVFENCSVS